MASTIVASTATVARILEDRDIHLAACRYRAQGLVCSTCHDLAERAERAIRAAGIEAVREPVETLVIADGVVSWSRAA